jgi:hypothetical protein
MIPELRRRFNAAFSADKYARFLALLEKKCGRPISFRNCETPCFLPTSLVTRITEDATALVTQLFESPDYRQRSGESIPARFDVPRESPHPLFIQVDFGLVRGSSGTIEPRLVEIQGFASLYAYQVALAEAYCEAYDLDPDLRFLPISTGDYNDLLGRAILGKHDPENVALVDVDPWQQKTLPDFLLTSVRLGIPIVNVADIVKQGNRIFYPGNGKLIPIHRIYNRLIVDDLVRRNRVGEYMFSEDLDVEWAGHPNWFFRLSKFSIPFLSHPCVPQTRFLDQPHPLPVDLENYVLKPLYSFAGSGVVVGPSQEDIDRIPSSERHHFLLQDRLHFEPVIETPCGATQVEVRVMFIWLDRLQPGAFLLRMGRGKMMGVDYNREREWVGASAAFFPAG